MSLQERLKYLPHARVQSHFMKMCDVLAYGGTLRGFRIGHKIKDRLDPIRWSIMDAINQDEDEFDEGP